MNHNLRFGRDEHGATAVEYAIMVALIAIVIISAVILVGQSLQETYACAGSALAELPEVNECVED